MSRASIAEYAVGAAAVCGHDPADVREWSWRDVQLFLAVYEAHCAPRYE